MKSNYLVSIIMTCYNGEQYLKEAIESLIKQTYSNWELIFYDNNSSDSSANIIQSYEDKRIKYFKSDQLVNLGTIRKLAIEKCTGSFVSFLDVDDYWSVNKLEKQINKFKQNENLDIVYSNYYVVTKEEVKKIHKKLFNGKCQKEIILSYVNGMPLTAWLTLMIKKTAVSQLDYSFDTNLHISSDFDLIIRLSEFCNFDYVDDYLGFYRVHNFNESKKNQKEIEELNYILSKYKGNKNLVLIFNYNNFADKINIKHFIYKKKVNQVSNSVAINSYFYKVIYFFLKITPSVLLNLLNRNK